MEKISHITTPCLFVGALFVLVACSKNLAHAQYDIPDFIGTNTTNLLGIFDKFDLQKYIRVMRTDGSFGDMAQVLVGLGTAQYTIDTKCVTDFFTAAEGISNFEMWALQMIDAIGKPHTGILSDFDFTWDGSFDECLDLKAITYSNATLQTNPAHHFDGKYCRVGLPIPEALTSLDPVIKLVSGGQVKVGICIPNSCNTNDLKNIMRFGTDLCFCEGKTVAQNVFNASEEYMPDAECRDGREIETKTIVAICILSIFGVIVAIGTLYDIYLRLSETTISKDESKEKLETKYSKTNDNTNGDVNGDVKVDLSATNGERENGVVEEKPTIIDNAAHESKPVTNGTLIDVKNAEMVQKTSGRRSTVEKIFLSFSAYSNGLKILSTNQPKGALTCINGIRFLSMTWVILGHSVTFYGKNAIPYWFIKKINQWTFSGIYSATVSVDTFFTMSGLLVAYLTLREMSKRGGANYMNWVMFFFHRFWRLTPVYMIVLMFHATITKHLGDGPRWPHADPDIDKCSKYWWANLLYVNNYYPGEARQCFAWGWYLADDMQFYILSPLIIIPIFYNVAVGSVVAGMFLIATTVARAVISKEHEYTALFGAFVGPKAKDENHMDNIYVPAHTRIGPYIIGLITGYLLYRYKDSIKLSKAWTFLGWLASFSIIVLVIYGVYPDERKHYLSVNESVAYVTLHRAGWGIAVSWIIFACATGHGGWINDFLSWSPFGPLGRLSYCAYLVHLIELHYYSRTLRQPLYMTDLTFIYFYIGNVVLSYMVAFVTSLMFESPMMGLERVMFRKA